MAIQAILAPVWSVAILVQGCFSLLRIQRSIPERTLTSPASAMMRAAVLIVLLVGAASHKSFLHAKQPVMDAMSGDKELMS